MMEMEKKIKLVLSPSLSMRYTAYQQIQLMRLCAPVLRIHAVMAIAMFVALTPFWLLGLFPFYKQELWCISTLYLCVPLFISVLIVMIGNDPIIFQWNYAAIAAAILPVFSIFLRIYECHQGLVGQECVHLYLPYIYVSTLFLAYVILVISGLRESLTMNLDPGPDPP